MNWSDERQNEILIGTETSVRTFDTSDNELVNSFALPEKDCCGIFKIDELVSLLHTHL